MVILVNREDFFRGISIEELAPIGDIYPRNSDMPLLKNILYKLLHLELKRIGRTKKLLAIAERGSGEKRWGQCN
jgi:hypothetical protein